MDAVRFYLTRNLSFASDSDFSRAGLLRHYNDELGNDLGNLLNRVVSMIQRYRNGNIPAPTVLTEPEETLKQLTTETRQRAGIALDAWEIGSALNITWNLVRHVNQYIEQSAPWKLARQPEQAARLDTVLYSAAEATRLLAILLSPYIPSACNRILAQLGLGPVEHGAWKHEAVWGERHMSRIAPGEVLFPRLDAGALVGV
ncbi:MAG: class I tRNA ligase family protein [Ktedonobacteraceae bacterium]|nr:class I tRNA ligase family protein [Ktedonobacteraceae bacterium]